MIQVLLKNLVAMRIENSYQDHRRGNIEQAPDPLEKLLFCLFALFVNHINCSF